MHGCSNHFQTQRRGAVLSLMLAVLSGCSLPTWMAPQHCALDPGISKTELVAHLNQNVVGTETHPRLVSWRSGNSRVKVNVVPISLQASIAVEAPRNFRILVSNPIGAQEVDIGSNPERFWIWTKDNPEQVMTVKHEDVSFALQRLQFPVDIQPDWLMQVFGVIPLDPDELELVRPQTETGQVELVDHHASQFGEDVERVIRVNLRRGVISEHALRLPGGKIVARAILDNYTVLPNGMRFPQLVRLQWPDAHMEMILDIRNPEVNPPALAQNSPLWQVPRNIPAVDLGMLARRSGQGPPISPAGHQQPSDPAIGRKRLADSVELEAPLPAVGRLNSSVPTPKTTAERDPFEWARK